MIYKTIMNLFVAFLFQRKKAQLMNRRKRPQLMKFHAMKKSTVIIKCHHLMVPNFLKSQQS